MLWALKRNILPCVFAALFIWVGVLALARPIFAVADSLGYVCPKDAPPSDLFSTNALCWRSKWEGKADTRYVITLTIGEEWKDGPIEAALQGYGAEDITFWKYLALPLRRSLAQPWFKPIARVGYLGSDEYVLEPARAAGKDVLQNTLVAEI